MVSTQRACFYRANKPNTRAIDQGLGLVMYVVNYAQ